jgi:O-antigen/teichoic acid export membrane protein
VAAGVAFFLVRFQWSQLGQAGYGTAEVITTVVFFTILTDLGLRAALSRHMAERVALDDIRGLNEQYNAAMSCYLVLGIVLAAGFALLAEPLVDRLNIEPQERSAAINLIRYYVTLSALFSFVIPVYAAVLEAYHRFDITDVVHVSEILVRAAAIVVMLSGFKTGLYGWAAAMLLARLCNLAIMAYFAYRMCPRLALGRQYLNPSAYAALFSLGGYLFLHTTIQQINTLTDPLVVSAFLGSSAVALYRPALLVMTSAYPFVAGLSRQVKPLVTAYYATGREELVHEVTIRGTRLTVLIGIPFCVIFGAFALPIIRVWLGGEPGSDVATTATVLSLLALLDLSTHIRETQSFVMTGLNRVRYMSLVQTAGGIASIGCGIALMWFLKSRGWGYRSMIGVPLPTVCLSWIQLFIITHHIGVETGIGRWRYLVQGFGRAMLVLIVTAGFAITLNHVVQPAAGSPATLGEWIEAATALVLCVLATGLVWLAASWFLGLDRVDQARIRGVLWAVADRCVTRGRRLKLQPQSLERLDESQVPPLNATGGNCDVRQQRDRATGASSTIDQA